MMTIKSRQLGLTSVFAGVLGLALASHAYADDFVVDSPVTSTQTVDGDDTLIITEDGSISTTGNSENGVASAGDDNIITNNGTISTSGGNASGIYDLGAGTVITNNGTILAASEGIFSLGDDALIINNGTIDAGYDGISNDGDRVDITNYGVMLETGIFNTGDSAVITNTGTIDSLYDGIFNDDGADAIITNTGKIQADDDGIYNRNGSDTHIINYGTIQADDDGIYNNNSDDAIIINGGALQAGNDGVYNNSSDNAVIINNGTIRAGGDGIYILNSDDVIITNNGTSQTAGDGIYIYASDRAVVTNSGEIRTNGSGENGIFARNSVGTTINNYGLLVSELHTAIRVGAGSSGTTVHLGAPAYIGGGIFFGSTTTLNISTGASHSVLWQLPDASVFDGGAPNFSGPVPWFYEAATGEFATFDPTGLTASLNQLADTANTLARVGRYGLGRARAGNGARSASDALLAYGEGGEAAESFDVLLASNSSPATAYGPASGRFWITGFGGYANHDGDDATLDQRIDQIGAALGYAWQHSPDARLSVMAGYMNGTITAESPWADAQDIDSNGVFAGVYGDRRFGPVTLGLGVSGGWQTNDSTRFVNDNLATSGGLFTGESTAVSSYDSWFVTPEATLSADIGLGPTGLIYTTTVRGRYALQRTGGYTETGSNANATVDAHTFGIVEGDFELALSRTLGLATVTGRAGYFLRSAAGNDDVPVTLLGITNSVGLGATDRSTAYLGASLDLDLGPKASFTLDGQGYLSDDIDALEGMARLAIRF
ncbi:autotransporter outer membrane beta-barrel domain-containing protein [Roseibium sp.]|uniref:autotransporter outer membrane beta-barrel domain-containing protein n=1 Tax=Roseibium sp. TaxID=1936156 RepID=UPI003B50E413